MILWWSDLEHPTFSPGGIQQSWDVVIVGGGFSGLWTAHHLLLSDPKTKIAILEKGRVGSGASGRNGGWVSALYPIDDDEMLKHFPQSNIDDLHSHLRKTIDDIGAFLDKEGIEAGFHKGGSLSVARNLAQLQRLHSHQESTLLNVNETQGRIRMNGALGAKFTPDCAAINPAALVVGLAQSLEKRGVAIFENTEAAINEARQVSVEDRKVEAGFVVRAVEAYHERTRDQVPIYSLMVATEPLPETIFEEVGLSNRETFAEASHLVTYAQRTADNRLAIGGRGAPYTWGSRRNIASEAHENDHERLREMARGWFPVLKDFRFTHSWGGAIGVTRDWAPYVRTENGYGEMGGYAGDGVTLSYLAAGAMADLVQGRSTARAKLPFVQWRNPKWEPEPLRWIAINAAIRLSGLADKEENRTNRPSRIMKVLSRITKQ